MKAHLLLCLNIIFLTSSYISLLPLYISYNDAQSVKKHLITIKSILEKNELNEMKEAIRKINTVIGTIESDSGLEDLQPFCQRNFIFERPNDNDLISYINNAVSEIKKAKKRLVSREEKRIVAKNYRLITLYLFKFHTVGCIPWLNSQ